MKVYVIKAGQYLKNSLTNMLMLSFTGLFYMLKLV